MADWNVFPYPDSGFDFAGEALAEAWDELHTGDRVVFPEADHLQDVLEQHPGAAPEGFDGDLETLADTLQEAWRAFHLGDFQRAVDLGERCGLLGHAPANKATGIYASYLEQDEQRQAALFSAAADRAEQAIQALPDDPNACYFHAFNLGRYSQSVSVVAALRQGIGGKIQSSLDRTLQLEPDHAEAHTAYGMYHAEIIDKVGKMIGGMTYGASADKALTHFERALELTPDSPIAHIEFGNGLYLLHGDRQLDRVTDLYIQASEMTPRDAMEKLDVQSALAELE
jgi:tetratricopeptide (TPR) repeat protein